MVGWEIPRKYVKYNLSVTFVESLFSCTRLWSKNLESERICTIDGSKRVKSGKDVPFGGFVKKFSPPPSISPKFENFALRKQFLTQNTYKSWRIRIGTKQPMRISNLGFVRFVMYYVS